MHIVWINPNKPPPAWLHWGVPDDELGFNKKQLQRLRWYRKIYTATPPWETRARIAEVYKHAHYLRSRGFDMQVDHITPLNHPEVCGLHTVDNLQIIPKAKNAKKSNHVFPGMLHEQLHFFEEIEQLEMSI